MAPLTRRQQEVLCLIARDVSNAEIARRLVVSVGTVESHKGQIARRLGFSGRQAQTLLRDYARGDVESSARGVLRDVLPYFVRPDGAPYTPLVARLVARIEELLS